MHLTLEEFELYLTNEETTPRALKKIAPIQEHLDECYQCRAMLSKLSLINSIIEEETLSYAGPLLQQEASIRQAIVLATLQQYLFTAPPAEQSNLNRLITDFTDKRYQTQQIRYTRPSPMFQQFSSFATRGAASASPSTPTTNDHETKAPPFSGTLKSQLPPTFFEDLATWKETHPVRRPAKLDQITYDFSGPKLTVFAPSKSPATHMILMPESGLEKPQLQPTVYDEEKECYKAVFSVTPGTEHYQVYLFDADN